MNNININEIEKYSQQLVLINENLEIDPENAQLLQLKEKIISAIQLLTNASEKQFSEKKKNST